MTLATTDHCSPAWLILEIEVEMLSLKVMIRLIATMILLSMGFVLYPQSANAAKYCAELRGATATGHPDWPHSRRIKRVAHT